MGCIIGVRLLEMGMKTKEIEVERCREREFRDWSGGQIQSGRKSVDSVNTGVYGGRAKRPVSRADLDRFPRVPMAAGGGGKVYEIAAA